MRLARTWLSSLTVASVLSASLLSACHQSTQQVRPDGPYPTGGESTAYPASEVPPDNALPPPPPDPGYGGSGQGGAPAPTTAPSVLADKSAHQEAYKRRQVERPGLGTEYGEAHYSPVRDVPFERGSSSPLFLGSIHYNDFQGAQAQRERLDRRYYPGEPVWRTFAGNRPTPWAGVTIAVVDGSGQPLPAYHLANHILVVGSAGQNYAIAVENRTGQRFELVASVDGQDVVDGRSASLEKRGYVVDPYRRILIEGFRRDMSQVAAFRFGSVRNSYAARTSEFGDRNVGVIGVALFGERGAPQPGYGPDLDDEARRREAADPFPGRFAPPPPAPTPRPYY